MTSDRFEAFLKNAIGLDPSSIGSGAIDRAVRERVAACACADPDDYWVLLAESAGERQELIESVVVPETWFFRDPGAFAALVDLAKARAAALARRPLRLLSVPSSTGEEPYSMAMALLDAGIERTLFAIDAVDVSARAIEVAQAGQYRRNSFRGGDQSFRERHFTADRLHESVRESVRYRQANLLDLDTKDGGRYDGIFCRNLLIYFDRPTQDRAIAVLAKLLADDGVLFVGPSESGLLLSHRFESINWSMGFAFRLPRTQAGIGSRALTVPSAGGSNGAAHSARVASRKTSGAHAQRATPGRPRISKDSLKPKRSSGSEQPDTNVAADLTDLLAKAREFADRGDGVAARECCERFIRTAGPSAQAFYLLGLLEDSTGETSRAIERYRRALYLDPHHQEALIHLAVLIEGTGDVVGARRFYERAKRAAARSAGT